MNTKEDTFAALNGLRPIKDHDIGDLIPIEDFKLAALQYAFVNDDGMGYWATDKYFLSPASATIEQFEGGHGFARPSSFLKKDFKPPHWATHVLWYNR